MGDHGIKKNASGYYDEPCYKAVTAGPQPGEIYTHRTHSDYVLILNSSGPVSACLKLEDKPREGKIMVMAKVPMYTDPLKVSYVYEDLLGAFVKQVKEPEFKAIKKAVARALGL